MPATAASGSQNRKKTNPSHIHRSDKLALAGGMPVSPTMIPVVCAKLEEDEIQAVIAVLRSGNLRQGKVCEEFERQFAEASDSTFAITTCNGTTALQMAYEPIIGPGDHVLVPAFGFLATASMVIARGAIPIFCDVCADTFNIDADDAARRLTPRTTAIVATHLYGNPADIAAIENLADRHGLSVIFDAAQSHLARYEGQGIGAFGHATTFSFYPTKNMTTGEGGMVTTSDAELDRRLRLIRDHGMEPGKRYHHIALGYNYRLTDIAAAIGLKQLAKLPQRTTQRQTNAQRLTDLLASVPEILPPVATKNAEHVYHQYTIRLNLERLTCSRDEFVQALTAEGIGTATHYPKTITHQPIIESLLPDIPEMPVSEQLARQVLCLPVHHGLSDDDLTRIAEGVSKVVSAYRA